MQVDIKHFILILLACVTLTALVVLYVEENKMPSSSTQTPSPQTASEKLISNMNMTFNDEFDTFNQYLDANGNTTCGQDGTGTWQTMYYNCTQTTASNGEAQWYLASSTSVSDSILTIEAAPTTPATKNVPLPYTSGMITTEYSFSQTYGYFETRIQLPAGRGLWPAFWLLPVDKSWPPEIDAMEAFGDVNPVNGEGSTTMIHYASHVPPDNQVCGAWYNTETDVTAGFHTYGVDWEPDTITYYFDGTPYATCPGNPAANKPFYILLNLAVGGPGSWPGSPDASTLWPAYMHVDYVRAYQKK